MGKDILNGDPAIFILGAAKFDSPIESTSLTIARYLARNHNVYYIDYPFTWKDCIRLRKTTAYRNRKDAFSDPSKSIRSTDVPNLKIVIPPPVASINFLPEGKLYRFLLKRVEAQLRKHIQRVIRTENIRNYVYFNSFNFHYPGVADGLSPDLTVYQCVDPLVAGYDQRHGIVSEEKLVRESSLVICTSRQLWAEKSRLNPNTHFIPNAADITHSSKALDPQLPVHPELSGIPGPIIGYFGAVEQRIDFALLRQVIEQHPDKHFVLAGPVTRDAVPDWFLSVPNVRFTGSIPYEEMPAMIKGFDVALIPFRKDEFSRTIFPLKLFEYLGAGKPVVATQFNPDLKEFTGDTVVYAGDPDSFAKAITGILSGSAGDGLADRLAVAGANTWDRRAADLEQILAANNRGSGC